MSFSDDDVIGNASDRVARQIEAGGNALTRGLQAVAKGTVAAVALTPLTLGIAALTLGVGGLAVAIKSATAAATEHARALSSIRAQTGLGFGAGFGLTSRGALFGISPQQSAAMYSGAAMNPLLAGMRGAATGFGSPYDPNFLPSAARRYQEMSSTGPFGRLMANRLLDSTYGGQAPDSIRQTLNLRPGQIQAQLAYGQGVQKSMGISPEMLRKYAEEIPLASQRVGYAVNLVKIKLATELAPVLEKSFTGIATLLARNAGNIAKGIEKGVHFLVVQLPPMLLRGSAGILRGGAALLHGIGGFASGLAVNVRPVLTVFDVIIDGVKGFAKVLLGVASSVVQIAGMVYNAFQKTGIPKVLQAIGAPLTQQPNDSPENQAANGIVGAVAARAAWRAYAARGGARAAGAGRGAGSGASRSMFVRAMGALGRAVRFVRVTPLGTLARATLTGVASAASAATVGAGLVVGGLGYEALRKTNAFGMGSLPSSFQMARYGYNRMMGVSETEAALIAQGYGPNALRKGRKAGEIATPFTVVSGGLDAARAQLANYGESNLRNNPALQSTLTRLFGDAGSSATGGADKLSSLADSLEKKASRYEAEMNRALAEIARNTGKTADNTRPLTGNVARGEQILMDLVAATAANIASQGAQLQLRLA